jgi:hypothetical protein
VLVLIADMVAMRVLVRLGRDFDRNGIAGREMDDEADEWAGTVQYLSVEDEAAWQYGHRPAYAGLYAIVARNLVVACQATRHIHAGAAEPLENPPFGANLGGCHSQTTKDDTKMV